MTSRAGKPIVIAEYDPAWAERFGAERDAIVAACGDALVAVEHVGSTSVPGLAAKPIIDIMPGLRSLDDAPPLIAPLATLGYEYAPEAELPSEVDGGMPERRYFRKDVDGVRAFHMHMVEVGSEFWERHLLFRDYLRVHPDAALAYADLKRRLAAAYNETMLADGVNAYVGYTDLKTEFITATEEKARVWRQATSG
ncbi:MAG TPA: GrpB family protein [Casimicrobiaceae bacterium]|nr:GrpB family protein [Casimicrobiaceae bacterium]